MRLQNLQNDLWQALHLDETIAGISPHVHLRIYRNNILATLTDSLAQSFPCVLKLVGRDFFRMLAKEYIALYPSRQGNLQEYGEYFHTFLTSHAALKHLTYLSEVARFEWHYHKLHFAPNAASFDFQGLAAIEPQSYNQLRFTLHPASALLQFYFPILKIIELCTMEQPENIDLNAPGVNLLLVRPQFHIDVIKLSTADFSFLQSLSRHESLAQALSQALHHDKHFAVETKLPEFIQAKIIVGFSVKE